MVDAKSCKARLLVLSGGGVDPDRLPKRWWAGPVMVGRGVVHPAAILVGLGETCRRVPADLASPRNMGSSRRWAGP